MFNIILRFAAGAALTVTVATADDKKSVAPAANLVANGSMEAVADGKTAKWAAVTAEGGKVTLGTSEDKPDEGKRCLTMKGNAEWAVAFSEKVPLDRKKTYVFTGSARVKAGTAQIKIDYFNGDTYLGMTVSDDVTADKWEKLKVTAEPDQFADATHMTPCAVALGEFDAAFDNFVLTASEKK